MRLVRGGKKKKAAIAREQLSARRAAPGSRCEAGNAGVSQGRSRPDSLELTEDEGTGIPPRRAEKKHRGGMWCERVTSIGSVKV